ncbi:aspartate aminotransferase family protein [Pseudomonas eucalypticola]|uniref:Acetylornithine aminotransferase n=2 Tax=Pseudomonas eucalypticola TaxID=2599595 RepID=A0A7D5HYV5_9PSED|nr:aspartate aminotransferase family protein [Pseudomonas eucalypticola]QKZ05971.1 aspartate aminotransferase family protein [Pseudomonas eucalypticola]
MTALMNNYQPLPISFERGQGCRLWDSEGREYLDALAGVAVTSVGHSHPRIVDAIRDQAGLLLHCSNLYRIDWQARLAQRLTDLAGMARAFFCNSGAEANEAALKLARLHATAKGIRQPLVVVMENSFHGRTFATLSASDSPTCQAGFAPLVEGFVSVPFGDVLALEAVAQRYGQRIAAVLVEPVQGESGVQVAPSGYLKALRQICDAQQWLLMLDEIQTGLCRTGRWFAGQHEGVVPDVMTLAKALGNGVPIGACLATGAAADLFGPGSHGSTFGGNPLACRVACTVLDIMEQENLAANAAHQGRLLLNTLRSALTGHPGVAAVRGHGLMVGIELHQPAPHLAKLAALEHGLLINVARGRTIRLLPPLTLGDDDRAVIVERLMALLQSVG